MSYVWSSGGNIAYPEQHTAACGTLTAGLRFGGSIYSYRTEEYNGTAWSISNNLAVGRECLAGCGTQSAGLSFGGDTGSVSAKTEHYDGSVWSSGGDLATAREKLAGCGTESAGLSFGGKTSVRVKTTEHYNGTAWSSGGDLTYETEYLAGAGTQSAGLVFGGTTGSVTNTTEEYNGSAWSSGGDLNTARYGLAGGGTQSAGLSFGGTTGSVSAKTESYNGTAWSNEGDLAEVRKYLAGCGTSSGGLAIAGYRSIDAIKTTEEYDLCYASLFDAKIRIKDETSHLFDGQLAINTPTNLFDGNLHLLEKSFNSFDGKCKVEITSTDPFDGKLRIKDETTKLFDGKLYAHTLPGAWFSGGNLLTGRHSLAGCGTQSAGLNFGGDESGDTTSSVCEDYNGTIWSAGGNLVVGRRNLSGCGTQSAGLNFGGTIATASKDSEVTEEYNGTTWSSGGDLALARTALAGCGTQSAGLSFGGNDGGTLEVKTEHYNGTAWSNGGDLITAREWLAGAGTQSAGLSFGGYTTSQSAKTEEYNGSVWSSGSDLATARSALAGCGTQSDGLSFGGTTGSNSNKTEHYNGIVWWAGGDLTTARYGLAGCGLNSAGLSFGGYSYLTNTEVYGPGASANFTHLFDGWLQLFLPEAENFDGKVNIGYFPTNLFDGELRVKDAQVSPFDGKILIFNTVSNLFDGRIHLFKSSSDLFDGRAKVQIAPTRLFDGIIRIKDDFSSLLDGRIRLWSETTNLFDGRIYLFDLSSNIFDGKATVSSPGAEQDFFDGKIQIGNETTDLFDGKTHIHTGIPSIWRIGGDISVTKDFVAAAGTLFAGLCVAGRHDGDAQKITEEYNDSIWSISGDIAAAKYESSACGTQTAAINFAGWQFNFGVSKNTEHFNGSSWSVGGDLPSDRKECGAVGVETAALSVGGWFGGTPGIQTEEYNGTTWSSGGNLGTARYASGAAGTQSAGLSFGGSGGPSKTEEYNASVWSSGGDLIIGRSYLGGCGTQSAGLSFGGDGPKATTEEYDGTSWASASDLITARYSMGDGGVIDAGLCFGGRGSGCYLKSSEEYGFQTSDVFDGRLNLFEKDTPLFDGRVVITPPGLQEYDGRIYLFEEETDLFNGEIELVLNRSWSTVSGGVGRSFFGGVGTQTAGRAWGGYRGSYVYGYGYSYNGTAWGSGANLPTPLGETGFAGGQSDALSICGQGGSPTLYCYEYAPYMWTVGPSVGYGRLNSGGCGSQTSALCAGGKLYGGTHTLLTQEYNGSVWSDVNDLLSLKRDARAVGTQNAALCFSANSLSTTTEEYNGTVWSTASSLTRSMGEVSGAGVLSAALCFGNGVADEYDGTSWKRVNNLNHSRAASGGFGTVDAALSVAGRDYSLPYPYECYWCEEYGFSWYNSFDGKIQIKDITTNIFDGRSDVRNAQTNLFDGRMDLAYFGSDLFDAKLKLYQTWRESLLGGFGEPYKLDIDPPLGSSSICSVRFSLVVTETRTILSALGETIEYLLHIPMAEVNQQAVVNCLSNYISAIQRSLNRLSVGDPSSGKQSVFTSLQSDAGAVVLRNELSGIVDGIQSLITALTDGVSSHVSLINELALKEDIHSMLVLLGSVDLGAALFPGLDSAVLYPDCTLNVYLDGVPIKPKQITSLSFTMDRGVTFDVLSINSTDIRLYASLQMIVGNEDSVIEVQYQGTSWMFLIEEVSGFELSFSVWGRSIAAAKSDAPFKDSTNFVLGTDTLASSVAEDLVPELSVTWNVVDWTMLADWSVDGTPVQMLKTLADSIGAVVRTYPDGTGFYVDEKYTTRPVNLPYAASEADFDRDVNLISLDASRDLGTGANAVTVHGYSPLSKYSVRLEAESCVEVGSPAVIKVYPALNGVGYSLIASDGAPTYQHSLAEEHTETVSFVGGKGSVSYPITALTSIAWDGAAPAGFEYTAGQDEIVLTDDTPAAVGEVVYSTRYDVWYGTHSGEGQLLVVCYLDEGGGIVARVYFDEGDREADDIDRPILTSIAAAVAAGQAFLDDTSYNRLLRSISAPCSDVSDGDVVFVSSDLSGVTGNTIVLRHEVSAQVDGEALKISSNLEVVQFEV